jgi:hypothetical protein
VPWDDSRTLFKPQYIFVNLGKSWSVEKNKTTKRLLFPYSIWLTQKMMATLYDVGKIQSIIILKKYSRMRIVNRRKMQLFENFE